MLVVSTFLFTGVSVIAGNNNTNDNQHSLNMGTDALNIQNLKDNNSDIGFVKDTLVLTNDSLIGGNFNSTKKW